MALYDNYRQANSSFISQHVGSIAPEVGAFVQTMKGRYDTAREQDDTLIDALSNMTHLQDEADTLYANELKQDMFTRLSSRVEAGDYENMERQTKADARRFVSEYRPLINRQQAFQAIQERVMSDENVFSPEKKQQILNYIRHTNRTQQGPDGQYLRDANGKIQLGAIQDWAYAKDVDVDKRLVDILKEVEAELTQSGFAPDGQGLMVSQTNEVRTKEDMYQMAIQRMQSDPEIKAMLKRDATLSTYNIQGPALDQAVLQRNRSKYEELADRGLKADEIKQLAVNSGMTVDDLKVRPFDMIAEAYAKQGMSPEQAKRDFLQVRVEQELGEPHADLVSSILKVQKKKLDARADPVFAAELKHKYDMRLKDYEAQMEKAELIQQYTEEGFEGEDVDFTSLQQDYREANNAYTESVNLYKNSLGDILGNKPTVNSSKEETQAWNNQMASYLNSPTKQTEILNATTDRNKRNELQSLFARHNEAYGKMTGAKQALNAIPDIVRNEALDAAWIEHQKAVKGAGEVSRFKSRDQFAKYFEKFNDKNLGRTPILGWRDRDQPGLRHFNKWESTYFDKINEGMKKNLNTRTPVSVFEPYGSGYVKEQTQMFTSMAAGNPNSFVSGTVPLSKYLEEQMDDLKWKDADKRNYMNNMRVRLGNELASDGKAQFAITLPNGSTRMFTSESFGTTKSKEMLARLMESTAHTYTEQEYQYQLGTAARALSSDEFLYTNTVMLDNTRKGQTVAINDKYGYKVQTSAKDSNWGSPTTGTLVVKDPRTGKYLPITDENGRPDPKTQNMTIEQLQKTLGASVYQNILRQR